MRVIKMENMIATLKRECHLLKNSTGDSRKIKGKNMNDTGTLKRQCYHLKWSHGDITPEVIAKCGFIQLDRTTAKGDTGNQMFQIASLYGIAHSLDMIPVINDNLPLLKFYDLPNVIKISLTNTIQCPNETTWQRYTRCERSMSRIVNMTLTGYRQSWKYFKLIETDIAKIFRQQFKGHPVYNAEQFFGTLPINFVNIGIHVRRTDKLRDMIKIGHATAGADYYEAAMTFFKAFFNKINFIVMTDDMDWVKKNLVGDNIYYSPFTNKTDDLALMSRCQHMILTYGSFGWWGAYMANGTTVHFDRWYKTPRRINPIQDHDFYTIGSFIIGTVDV
ncbi:glycosyltransferase 11 [Mactra antiquata]